MTNNDQSPRAGAGKTLGMPVAWCQLTASGQIAYFDGKPMVMPGPVGNDCHPDPLYPRAQPAPAAKLEDFCGVMQEVREDETACGTKYQIAKWTCPSCGKACSTLNLDGEACHGDGLCITFANGERFVRCTSCWLAAEKTDPTNDVIDLRGLAERAGIRMDLWDMGAASLAYTEGVHGVTRAHLEKFAALYGFACWNAALEANPPAMQGFISRAIGSLFQAPATAYGSQA